MTGCSVTNCTNRTDSGKSLYRIPTARNDVRRRLVWLLRMGRRTKLPSMQEFARITLNRKSLRPVK
ncbi:unnamed protein product [Ixodes hexagonus]